jgi:hypothetical protein
MARRGVQKDASFFMTPPLRKKAREREKEREGGGEEGGGRGSGWIDG